MSRDNANGWVRVDERTLVYGVVLFDRSHHTSVRIVLVASDRKDAIARIKAAGGHNIRLTTNDNQPDQEEIEAAVAAVDQITWRPWIEGGEWQPIANIDL